MSADAALVAAVHERVLRDGDADIRRAATRFARSMAPLLPTPSLADVVDAVAARATGLGPLQPLLADPSIDEVLVVAGTEVWVERAGRLQEAGIDLTPGEAEALLERILAPLGRRADRTSPVVDARLPDGSRVHAVLPPLAVDGISLCIRRFGDRPLGLDAFAPPPIVELMRQLVHGQANVLVTGPTSAGKTSLLNALAGVIPRGSRIVTIEDAAELRLQADHVVRLEARPPTTEGTGGASVQDLVRAALRMRPDRLVLGEVRGAEAADLLQALSTGHDGSLATCHANSAGDALARLEAMVLQGDHGLPLPVVHRLVHGAIDVVVHLERGQEGRRQVAEVLELADDHHEPRWRVVARAGHVVGPLQRRRRAGGSW